MTYIIKMMNGDKIEISDEAFKKISLLPTISGMIKLNEIGGIINLSSVVSILDKQTAERLEDENPEKTIRRKLGDGTNAIRRKGIWYDEDKEDVKLDVDYYKSLKAFPSNNELLDGKKYLGETEINKFFEKY